MRTWWSTAAAPAASQRRPGLVSPAPLHEPDEEKRGIGRALRDIILGGQDGLVNVLGVVLGVAAATAQLRIIMAAALAATFSESIAMAGVAYTSALAERDYYLAQLAKERREVEELPGVETEEVRQIFRGKGIHGELLEDVVKEITSDKDVWVDVMMRDELHLAPVSDKGLAWRALIVGFSALIGSLIPLIPFLFVPLFGISLTLATILALPLCGAVLFAVGAYKALTLVGDWRISGLQMLVIGMVSAAAGYLIGRLLNVGAAAA
jgi:vacuolar iron transporter family protein